MANTTWNPADRVNCTLTGLNLLASANSAGGGVRTIDFQTAGKYYWEYTLTHAGQSSTGFGIANASGNLATMTSSTAVNGCYVSQAGNAVLNGFTAGFGLGTLPNLSLLCLAMDKTATLLWFRSGTAGNWNGSGTANPATAAGGLNISSIAAAGIYPMWCFSTSGTEQVTANFGDTAFSGAVPAGFTSGFPQTIVGGGAQARAMVLA